MIGLLVGVALGLPVWATMSLDTALAVVFGMSLAAIPVVRDQGVGMVAAFRMVGVGGLVSIGVMELVMNDVDYRIGGFGTNSVNSRIFWAGFLLALPPGLLAAWPVNHWMLAPASRPIARRPAGHGRPEPAATDVCDGMCDDAGVTRRAGLFSGAPSLRPSCHPDRISSPCIRGWPWRRRAPATSSRTERRFE